MIRKGQSVELMEKERQRTLSTTIQTGNRLIVEAFHMVRLPVQQIFLSTNES